MKIIGVKYIIFDSGSYPDCLEGKNEEIFLTCQTKKDFRAFLGEHGELIRVEGNFELYKLKQ
jgi:hypothetical protein